MKYIYSAIIVLFFSSLNAQNVNLVWAKGMGGGYGDGGNAIAVDAAGNVYTTGSFRDIADFDPGAATHNLTAAGTYDIFISKFDASGNFVWAKSIGGVDDDAGNSIAVDGSGNVYTTGYFQGTADFDPGTGTYNLTSVGFQDIFVSKLDSAGNFVWAKRMGGADDDRGNSIVIDPSGNIYTTGFFDGAVDFDPGSGTYNLTSTGFDDIFVSKLNSSGNFVWAKRMGSTATLYCDGYSIALDASRNVYTTGSFSGTADFDPGSGTYNLTSVGFKSAFVSKLDSSGNFVWAKNMGGTSSSSGYSIAVNASGNVYTLGYFYGTADFDPGSGTYNLTSAGQNDIFVSKLDVSGNFVWAKSMGGVDVDYGNSIAVDAFGNAYIIGYFNGTADFDPGAGIYNLTSAGQNDIFISVLNTSGNFVWAKKMGGADYDYGNCIAMDASGILYATGSFWGTVNFDPGSGTYNLTSAGLSDVFVLKLGGVVGLPITSIDFGKKNDVTIIPNPASGILNIGVESMEQNTHIEIYNAVGQMILSEKLIDQHSTLNTSDFPPGFYLVKVLCNDQIQSSKKIIIRH